MYRQDYGYSDYSDKRNIAEYDYVATILGVPIAVGSHDFVEDFAMQFTMRFDIRKLPEFWIIDGGKPVSTLEACQRLHCSKSKLYHYAQLGGGSAEGSPRIRKMNRYWQTLSPEGVEDMIDAVKRHPGLPDQSLFLELVSIAKSSISDRY